MENFYYNASILYWARHLDLKKKKNLTKILIQNKIINWRDQVIMTALNKKK